MTASDTPRQPKAFSQPVIIKEMHLDTFGHVNNATYLTLLEDARWDLVTSRGYGLQTIQRTGLGPVILELGLSFLKELRLREEIIIETQMLSYENRIGRLSQKMLRGDELCCKAEFVMGLFSLAERKLVPPTPEWLAAIGMSD